MQVDKGVVLAQLCCTHFLPNHTTKSIRLDSTPCIVTICVDSQPHMMFSIKIDIRAIQTVEPVEASGEQCGSNK